MSSSPADPGAEGPGELAPLGLPPLDQEVAPEDLSAEWDVPAKAERRHLRPEDVAVVLDAVNKARESDHHRDSRGRILVGLFVVLLVVIVGGGCMVWGGLLTPEGLKDLWPLVLTPLFTLLGTAVAFHYRSGSAGDQ